MKSKGILIASAVAAALTMAGCAQHEPQPGSASMGPAAKSHHKCGSNKCKAHKSKSHKCKAHKCKSNKCKANSCGSNKCKSKS